MGECFGYFEKSQLKFTFEQLEEIVETNDKQRFCFNQGKTKIRANQGHSLKTVDLDLKAKVPPVFLYHGTIMFIPQIEQFGLKK